MVQPVMAGDRSPKHPRDEGKPAPGANAAWAAISYLIGGILVWGFAGWLVDRWLDTGGIATAIGAVVGAAGGVVLIARRLGR
jgi:F0F1-type ATP synthase assembly protein I